MSVRYTTWPPGNRAHRTDWLRLISVTAVVLVGSLAPTGVRAQPFPTKPLRFVVGSAPGSGNDITARMLAARVSESWGQQIVVENRAGGGQIIAAEIVARATPDGYSLLQCGVVTMAINPALHKKLSYDPSRDFAPITSIATAPNVLVVHPSVPARTAKEFIAHVLAHPGKFNYGSGGVGSTLHLSMEMLKTTTGMAITHVPYKGGGLAMADLYAGQIIAAFQNLPVALGAAKSGKARAIAVTSAKRSTHLPEVPTFIEAGYPNLEITVWYGVCAPSGVREHILARLNEAIVQVLKLPDVRERFTDLGVEPWPSSSQEFAAFLKSERVKWAKAVKDSGTTPQ
jgi:tripartite-type tricarboxylate transporter receptor subunit TctC